MSESVPDQRDLIHGEDWDYLLVIDACRSDYFQEEYRNFLTGDYQTAWSAGTNTLAWLSETFPDEYAITYVSGHALVNSAGHSGGHTSLRERVRQIGGKADYTPAEHFAEIIDTWDWGYEERIETVPPWAVNRDLRRKDTPLRVIAHYVQPHFPWVRGYDAMELDPRRKSVTPDGRGEVPTLSRQMIQMRWGDDVLRRAYRDNLRVALSGVASIVPDLSGRIIVTSDHGEYLEGDVGHPPGSDDPILREVPWLEVTGVVDDAD